MKRLLLILLCLCALSIPVRAEEKLVALTFDDGPSGRFTRTLLEGLRQEQVPATFLLCGYRMEQYPDLTRQILREGHEIGLHGYSHRSMESMEKSEILREIQKTRALLPEEAEVLWLRPPGGLSSKQTVSAAKAAGLPLLHWSVDPRDWATHDALAVEKQVICHVKDGDIILLHDMTDSSVEAALAIVRQLKEQGFRFVTVSQLARARSVIPEPGKEYSRFGS